MDSEAQVTEATTGKTAGHKGYFINREEAQKLIKENKAVWHGKEPYLRMMADLWESLAKTFVYVGTVGKWLDTEIGLADGGLFKEEDAQREVNQRFVSPKYVLTYRGSRQRSAEHKDQLISCDKVCPQLKLINDPNYCEKLERYRRKPNAHPDEYLLRTMVVSYLDTKPNSLSSVFIGHGAKKKRIFNLWTPPAIYASSEEIYQEPRWFLDVVDLNLGKEDSLEKTYWLDWFAHAVCRPEVKINTTLLLISEIQGTGKGFMARALSLLVSEKNTQWLRAYHFKQAQFQGFILGTTLGVINEICEGRNSDFVNKLKVFQTEPKISINQKFISERMVTNYVNFLAFSNEDFPIAIEVGDRRWAIFKSQVKQPLTGDKWKTFFNNCFGVLENKKNGGKPNMKRLGDLRRYFELRMADIEKTGRFDPHVPAPWSEHKGDVIEASRSPYYHRVADALDEQLIIFNAEEGSSRFRTVSLHEIDKVLLERDPHYRPPVDREKAKDLRALGFTKKKFNRGNRWLAPEDYKLLEFPELDI
jgi:hypothetical protein